MKLAPAASGAITAEVQRWGVRPVLADAKLQVPDAMPNRYTLELKADWGLPPPTM
ncbi:hypothetical protein GCM10022409_47810 [Hymenobacter glaciei]|uniref:Uncharacterized protein n=1 Tax=Hymenobacter glaciei TaxID=877209 RepID=A0ABP7UXK1_9BACT